MKTRLISILFAIFAFSSLQAQNPTNKVDKSTEVDNAQEILNWCENLRQAYIDKNLPFLDAVFNNDAIIITADVTSAQENNAKNNIKSKAEYLAELKKVFARPGNINVIFEDYKVQRHPSKPNSYYVTLNQSWNTEQHSDEGIVILVWDFTNKDFPKILVRTWQPIGTNPFSINDIPLN